MLPPKQISKAHAVLHESVPTYAPQNAPHAGPEEGGNATRLGIEFDLRADNAGKFLAPRMNFCPGRKAREIGQLERSE